MADSLVLIQITHNKFIKGNLVTIQTCNSQGMVTNLAMTPISLRLVDMGTLHRLTKSNSQLTINLHRNSTPMVMEEHKTQLFKDQILQLAPVVGPQDLEK